MRFLGDPGVVDAAKYRSPVSMSSSSQSQREDVMALKHSTYFRMWCACVRRTAPWSPRAVFAIGSAR